MLSVALTRGEDQAFTNVWRALISYGPSGTGAASRDAVLRAHVTSIRLLRYLYSACLAKLTKMVYCKCDLRAYVHGSLLGGV